MTWLHTVAERDAAMRELYAEVPEVHDPDGVADADDPWPQRGHDTDLEVHDE